MPQRPVFMTGFMATGKSKIGRLLAHQMGRVFLDTDELVEEAAGCSIADIFAHQGEEAFRCYEAACVARAAFRGDAVVSLGGGAITRQENLKTIEAAGGVLVCVEADIDTILERVGRKDDRPLLAGLSVEGKRARIRQLLAERAPFYDRAHLKVRTSETSDPEEVAAAAARQLEALMAGMEEEEKVHRVEVALEGRGYAVHVGHGFLSRLGAYCAELGLGRQVAVITDRAVAGRHLGPVCDSLKGAGFEVLDVVFEGGDAAKNLTTAEGIFGRLIEAELDRGCWVLALGGGVVGDMAGFVAASYLRGVPYVQVPTTVVAQVDASVGGKTAVNHRLGKNLIGAFHQPRMVFADTDTLRTLPRAELVGGLAEVVKHGVIRDVELFEFLEKNIERVVALDLAAADMDWLIARNVAIKAAVVAADEREGGLRAILNYGHTVGHAIETATDHRYSHGEAVILGMIAAGHIARLKDLWSAEDFGRQDALLKRLGVPAGLGEVDADLIVRRTSADKKRVGGRLRFVLPRRLGEVEVFDDVGPELVAEAVAYVQQNY